MIRSFVNSKIISFSDSFENQEFRTVKSSFFPLPIFCKSPAFQIAVDLLEEISSIKFVTLANDEEITIGLDSFAERYKSDTNVILIGKENVSLNLEGLFFMKITDRTTTYYSTPFELKPSVDSLFRISYTDESDIDNRIYGDYFKETFCFAGNIKSIKPFIETKSVKRSGEEYFTERVYYDQFQISFHSYLNTALAVQRMNLFDNIEFKTPKKEVFTVTDCNVAISELGESGLYNVTVQFKTNRIFKNTAVTASVLTKFIKGLSSEATSSNYIYTDESGYKYTMFYRTVVNPLNNNIIRTFKLAYSHTEILQYFYLEISRDRGVSFSSLDGSADYSKINVGQWINNPTPVYTATGRLIVFFQWQSVQTGSRQKASWIYSDDDGLTWSAMQYFTDPVIAGVTILNNSYFYSNRIIYNATGELLMPYWLRITETGRSALRIAKSNTNGASWVDTGVTVFQNSSGTKMEMTESEWVQSGANIFMITRTSQATNNSGHVVPAMFYSSDFGATWKTGGGYHSVESLEAKDNKCGFLYLEGPAKSLGIIGATFNEPLPSINIVEYSGVKWLVIFYWIRLTPAGEQTVQKWTVVKVSDYLVSGVDSVKNISQIIFDGTNHSGLNKNGGNGCADNFGEDILFSTYSQETPTSGGGTSKNYNIVLRKSDIVNLINAYNA